VLAASCAVLLSVAAAPSANGFQLAKVAAAAGAAGHPLEATAEARAIAVRLLDTVRARLEAEQKMQQIFVLRIAVVQALGAQGRPIAALSLLSAPYASEAVLGSFFYGVEDLAELSNSSSFAAAAAATGERHLRHGPLDTHTRTLSLVSLLISMALLLPPRVPMEALTLALTLPTRAGRRCCSRPLSQLKIRQNMASCTRHRHLHCRLLLLLLRLLWRSTMQSARSTRR
jgi:hypothetical protein